MVRNLFIHLISGAMLIALILPASAFSITKKENKEVTQDPNAGKTNETISTGTDGTNQGADAMVNGGQLHNAETRAGLQSSLGKIGEGSKRIHDLVNKEGYSKESATKEFLKYLGSFNPPSLSGIRKSGGASAPLPKVPNVPLTVMSIPPYQPKNDDENRWLSFLKKNGYEPTEVNLRFVMNAAKQMEQEIDAGKIAPQTLANWGSSSQLNALDTIEIQADLQKIVDRERREASRTAASLLISSVSHDIGIGEESSRLTNDESAESAAEKEELIASEEAEIILLKVIGDTELAQEILDELKAEAGGDPVKFTKIFEEYQQKHLAKFAANKPKTSAKANEGIAKILGFSLSRDRKASREISSVEAEDMEPTPSIAILTALAIAISLSSLGIGIYFYRKNTGHRKLTRQFVVRDGDPEWVESLKKKAQPVAAKSRKDNRKPRMKKAS